MKQLFRPVAEIGIVAGAIAAGITIANPILGLVVGPIAINLASDWTKRGLGYSLDQLLSRDGILNHDLQRAMRDAFVRAIDHLQDLWWKSPDACDLQGRQRDQLNTLFAELRGDVQSVLSDDCLRSLLADSDKLQRLQTDARSGGKGVEDALASYFEGRDHNLNIYRLVAFLKKNVMSELAFFFTEELKEGKAENNRSWRAFQLVMHTGLQAGQQAMLDRQTEMADGIARLETWTQQLDALKDDEQTRDRTGQQKLIEQNDSLLKLIADEHGQTREEMRAGIDRLSAQMAAGFSRLSSRIEELETVVMTKLDLMSQVRGVQQSNIPNEMIWSIPFPPISDFTGREHQLAILAENATTSRVRLVRQAIVGIGGVGKTRLAAEHGHRHAESYDIVWWVGAENASTLASDYAALAVELNLQEATEADQPARISAVRRALETGSRHWCLIFDNAETSNSLVDYLPRRGYGHIVITSRVDDWDVDHLIDLGVLPPADAAFFLLARTMRSGESEISAARELSREMDGLPLALEQAASFVVANRTSLTNYLNLFRANRKNRLAEDRASRSKETVATTWDISLQRLTNESPAAAALLNLCACLAPDRIPLDLLIPHARVLPEPLAELLSDPATASMIAGTANRYGLLKIVDDQSLSMHRLVQLIARERMSADDRKIWIRAAVDVVGTAFPENSQEVQNWTVCNRLLPHSLVAGTHALDYQEAQESLALLSNQIGEYMLGLARFDDAKEGFERSLAITRAQYGDNHPNVTMYLSNLAIVQRNLGKLPAARRLYERALKIDQAKYGDDHPVVAIRIGNLAQVVLDQGDVSTARDLLERALVITRENYGDSDPRVASCLNNLGMTLRELGEFTPARLLAEQALEIYRANYGDDNSKTMFQLGNLALVLQDQGDLDLARDYFERVLKFDRVTYGESHPRVALRLNNLALLLRDKGELTTAYSYLERALAIDFPVYGEKHPNIALRLGNLAMILQEQGDFTTARRYAEQALAIDLSAYGEEHPRAALRFGNLASILEEQGDQATARGYYERALMIDLATYGDRHPKIAVDLENLAVLLWKLGDTATPRSYLENALAITVQSLPANHPRIKHLQGQLAVVSPLVET